MTRLSWGDISARHVETGVDRGVVYLVGLRARSLSTIGIPTGGIIEPITEPLMDNFVPEPRTFVLSPPMSTPFEVGSRIKVTAQDRWMRGVVTESSYNSVTIMVDSIFGAGTYSTWILTQEPAGVAWQGLTSVEESGGESSTPYYLDGRPYLYFPKPKEYEATVSAYTYPDEFSQVMGIVEIADGMYLDSQVGENFSFSYRTRILDAIQGDSGGYKIHLVYNATLTPSPISYQSLVNSINPVEFKWSVNAVPVVVPGYRPTAHIIIDTRHVEARRLDKLEALLYGTPTSHPRIPDPVYLYDLLGFGDSIIITDHGDGTWSAEGSLTNVIDLGDGTFEIRNVNATDLGDGEYTISSTNV